MKIAFISDIHGNAVALDAVLEDIQTKNVDKIIVLGDLCFRGPEPKRALQLIQNLKTDVLKGNADEWVVRGIKQGEVPNQALQLMQTERDWTYGQLTHEDVTYLKELPTEHTVPLTEKLTIHCFHATPTSLFDVVPPTADNETLQEKLMSKDTATIFVYGHIHLPYIRFFNGKAVANLGSVGVPFDGLAQASYLIVEGSGAKYTMGIQRVPYDVDKVVRQYETANYPNLKMTEVIRNGSL
ncbi:metallophosphoesterase family protein [Evansella tamaricis]|uniref:Metallophosphatase family protein n=1 Tax=Evansella tamaricis TaxID=2069301 RepID=A0ABS6JGH2_9BACI|nr:metallophosphoesterase family protein [Evansella tamaricis]MBU9712754.1 metallophosphatase family protein [Evansella tamaricis]